MIIHIIDEEKYSVVELLVNCNMYEDSTVGEVTAASLLAFMKIFWLERSGWKFVMMDGFSVNTVAINWPVTLCENFNVNRVRCMYNFLSLVVKNMD